MTPLRDYLLDAYKGYADQRYKDRSLDRPIKVDSKGPHDVYPFFCSIFISVPERTGETLILTLQNCPSSPDVLNQVETLGGSVLPADFGPTVVLKLRSSQGPAVRCLARAIEAIVDKGRTYNDPNLRWICPRTAKALEELAVHLDDYHSERWPDDEVSRTYSTRMRRRRPDIPSPPNGTRKPNPSNGTANGRFGDGERSET